MFGAQNVQLYFVLETRSTSSIVTQALPVKTTGAYDAQHSDDLRTACRQLHNHFTSLY